MRDRSKIVQGNQQPIESLVKLDQIGQFLRGKGISRSDISDEGFPCLRYGEIYTTYGNAETYLKSRVSPNAAALAFALKTGDIIFAACGETIEEIGKTVAYIGQEPAYAGGGTLILREHGQDPVFLAHALNSEMAVRQKVQLGKGKTVVSIHASDLACLVIHLPPLPEQRRIAEILRTWDEAIGATKRIIRLREQQYRGLRERLVDWFAPKRRPLKALVKSVLRKVPRPKVPYRALGIRSHGKGTFERFVSDPTSVAMEHLYVANAGDLIVNITFAWEGAVALVPKEHDSGLVSHRFPTFEPRTDRVNPRFLRHALRMPRFTYLLGVVSPGGAGRNRVLNKADFLELDIPSPALKVQDRIADTLDDAETAIATERQSLELLQRQKRGLMQKILTGEWLVKVEE